MDTLSTEERRIRMSLIRPDGTGPELKVRSIARRCGVRFAKNARQLPGKPDLAFSSAKRAIFVHGCFWHRHNCKLGTRVPKSRMEFWQLKFEKNKNRDRRVRRELLQLGWKSLVIWECQLSDPERVAMRLERFLNARD